MTAGRVELLLFGVGVCTSLYADIDPERERPRRAVA